MSSARQRTATSARQGGLTETWGFAIGAALVLVIATAFRLWNLTAAPVWMDEAAAVSFARLPLSALVFEGVDNHPPLFYVLLHAWQLIAPEPVLARVPAMLAGIATIGVVLGMMRDLVSVRAALVAGLLLAICTSHIYFSQEARMYSLLMLGMAIAAWGALGHANPGGHRQFTYAALYVLGGVIAIYSHTIGLVSMFCVGICGLVGGLALGGGLAHARAWFAYNLVLLVFSLPWLLQLPSNMGFEGLHEATSLFFSIWYFKTATAYPGIGALDNFLAPVLYALAALGMVSAWLRGRRALAIMLLALAGLYPFMLFVLSLDRPVVSVRTMMPAALGISLAAGVGLDAIGRSLVRYGAGAIVVSAGLASSLYQGAHPTKPEDFPAAFAHVDAAGYGDAPVINCIDLSITASWMARPEADHYLQSRGGLLRFTGPDYWHAARMSMARYARASASEVDAYLGGGLLAEGGIPGAFADEDKVVFIRALCRDEDYAAIDAGMAELGFVAVSDTLMDARAPAYDIIAPPRTRVRLYRRAERHDQTE